MISKTIFLSDICPALADYNSKAYLTVYAREVSEEIDENASYPSLVICPGGAYRMTSDREAEPVALAFLARGFQCFVLRYSVFPARYPQALLELFAAIAYLRDHAKEYHLDPQKIISAGFSAGGHLAASSGILWNEDFFAKQLNCSSHQFKPNAMLLSYPVITAKNGYANEESFAMLLGENPDSSLLQKLSLENSVSKDTVPAFIWHTVDDNCVPSENSLFLALALKQHDIPFELHLYPNGAHGLSLADKLCACPLYPQHINLHVSAWFEAAVKWLNTL